MRPDAKGESSISKKIGFVPLCLNSYRICSALPQAELAPLSLKVVGFIPFCLNRVCIALPQRGNVNATRLERRRVFCAL